MTWVRFFEIGAEGRRDALGDFEFSNVPRIGEGVMVDQEGSKKTFEVTAVVHIARSPADDQPGTHLHGQLISGHG